MKRLPFVLLVASAVAPAAEAPDNDATKKDLDRMQGDWVVVSMVRDGRKIPDEDARAHFRTVKGDQYTSFHSGKLLGKGTFTLDATRTPRTIDVFPDGGPKDKPIKGIYEFNGETQKICLAGPDMERPTKFESTEGSQITVTVSKRQKK